MKNKDKIILDPCGGTGAWSKPYKDAGMAWVNAQDYDYSSAVSSEYKKVTFKELILDEK